MYYYSHVPVSEFPESAMAYDSPHNPTHGLSSIDGEVLQTIYTRLDKGTAIEGIFEIDEDDVSPDKLGLWDHAVIRYEGSFQPAIYSDWVEPGFGVDWRNGMARPWADGDVTSRTFAEAGLSGTVTWSGELVGVTPTREAVHGDSALRVDITAMAGSAAFTDLEHWERGAVPGNPGTGTQWEDGDLRYAITIDGNYIRSQGGDAGYISGRFVGYQYEGAVGILERPDLTGAFGGVRE
ncbi:MAG: hypothetical protein OXQ29_07880 [Rhodospirillaceae bacterium]|nr:hypothetical protein [Rhodospirillaceae bacterium]